MTYNEIIKALECCAGKDILCNDCAYFNNPHPACRSFAATQALNLIKHQRAEIERLEIELKAMRGAANSFQAEFKRLHEAEAKRMQETAAPLVIRNNKIPAQELAKMIEIGVISTDIEDADIELKQDLSKAITYLEWARDAAGAENEENQNNV